MTKKNGSAFYFNDYPLNEYLYSCISNREEGNTLFVYEILFLDTYIFFCIASIVANPVFNKMKESKKNINKLFQIIYRKNKGKI